MADRDENQIEQLRVAVEELTGQVRSLRDRVESMERGAGSLLSKSLPPASFKRSWESVEDTPVSKPVDSQPLVSKPSAIKKSEDHASLPEKRTLLQASQRMPVPPAKASAIMSKPASPSKKSGIDLSNLEQFLGVRGLAVLGMLIVVVAVGLFLKMAFDQGWVSFPPAARCWAAAVFGCVLLGVGEVFRRKINPISSSGVSAAGIATIYAAILAASKLYELVETPIAFALLVVVTVVGIGLGSLSNRVLLAALSLIGAFAVPILLSKGEPSYVVLPAYLFSLLVLGLGLSAWRGGSYGRVRQLAWWGVGLIGSMWLGKMYVVAPTSSLVFVSLVWLTTVFELIASSRFFKNLRDGTNWPKDSYAGFCVSDDCEKVFDPRSFLSREVRWINALFGATAWAVTASAMTLRGIDPKLDFIAPLGFALASVLLVLLVVKQRRKKFARFPESIWSLNASPRSALAASLIINAMLLGVVAIASALGGWVQVAAWALIGLGAIATARRIRFQAVGLFGFAMLGIAIGRLFSYDFAVHLLADPEAAFLGFAFTSWTIQIVLVACVCAGAAWISRYRVEASVAASAVLWLLGVCFVHPQASPVSVGSALLVLGAIAAWISVRVPMRGLRINTYIFAGLGMLVLLVGQIQASSGGMNHTGMDIKVNPFGLDINVISMLVGGLAWVAFAALARLEYVARLTFASLAIASGFVALMKIAQVHGDLQAIFFITLYAMVIFGVGHRLYRWSLAEIASVLLMLLSAAWVFNLVSQGKGALEGQPIVYLGFGASVLIIAGALWGGRSLPKLAKVVDAPDSLGEYRTQAAVVLLGLVWILSLASTSVEVVRTMGVFSEQWSAGGAAVSVWWSLFATASVALGFRTKIPALRWAGLVLLAVVAGKVLLVDTVTLSQLYRIIASLTVGLVIIAAGALYAWLAGTLDEPKPDEEAESKEREE